MRSLKTERKYRRDIFRDTPDATHTRHDYHVRIASIDEEVVINTRYTTNVTQLNSAKFVQQIKCGRFLDGVYMRRGSITFYEGPGDRKVLEVRF